MKKYMSQDDEANENGNTGSVKKIKNGKVLLNQDSLDGNIEMRASAGLINRNQNFQTIQPNAR